MAKYYEVSVPRKDKDGKTFWKRIGTAWNAKQGEGMNVELDALPLTTSDGRCSFIIRPPQDKPAAIAVSDAPLNEQLNDAVPW